MFAGRLLLLFATLLASLFATAASVEERSPFRQGHWWDPSRSGQGFELLNSGDQVFAVWYTYDAGGSPVWYTAQGPRGSLGGVWALQKHTWGDGKIARSDNVGTLRLTVNHPESITAAWNVDGAQGSWSIEPFVQSGTFNEVDLTGHWFDPAHSGWGMTLVDQGDVFGAVIYAYDPGGAPTWVAGFDRGKGTRIALYKTRGSCPSCAYQAPGSTSAGQIDIANRGDTEVTVRGAPTTPIAADLRIDGAQLAQVGRPVSTRRVDFQLAPFALEQTFRQFMVAGMDYRNFGGGTDFSPAPPSAASATSFSTTNLQEDGVDEGDFVKTDGRYVYALTARDASASMGARKVRIAYVGSGAALEPRGEMALYQASAYSVDASLYVHDGQLITLASATGWGGWYYTPSPGTETTLEVLSLANPEMPVSRLRAKLSGRLVSSRRIGDRLYVITRFTPNIPGYMSYPYTDQQRASNRMVLDATPTSALMPSISLGAGPAQPLVALSKIHAPQLAGRKASADLAVVSVFDLREARLIDSVAIAGRTDTLYVSTTNLYLASSRYDYPDRIGIVPPAQPALYSTDIHQIAIGASGLAIVATGSVEGTVGSGEMAPFRFGEYEGRLRVVTSTGTGMWGAASTNRLTILEPSAVSPGLLKTVSYIPNARRPEVLGKANEFLHSTRFVGTRLYAVTFKKVDPLYIVDLSDRTDPRITGALEIPGFSDYLHPLDNGVLLGFGKDTKPSDTSSGDGGQFAWYQGLHLTLFDVSNPSAPRQIQRVLMGKRGSDSPLLYSHHAFSALPRPDGTLAVAIPAEIHDGGVQAADWDWAPWDHSGLLRFEISGNTPSTARITQQQTLVSDRPASPTTNTPYDSEHAARSILFPDASVFVSNGRFFRMDPNGTQSGPY